VKLRSCQESVSHTWDGSLLQAGAIHSIGFDRENPYPFIMMRI